MHSKLYVLFREEEKYEYTTFIMCFFYHKKNKKKIQLP